jgi:hypothetical protein
VLGFERLDFYTEMGPSPIFNLFARAKDYFGLLVGRLLNDRCSFLDAFFGEKGRVANYDVKVIVILFKIARISFGIVILNEIFVGGKPLVKLEQVD